MGSAGEGRRGGRGDRETRREEKEREEAEGGREVEDESAESDSCTVKGRPAASFAVNGP
jgi:hypothetical protein